MRIRTGIIAGSLALAALGSATAGPIAMLDHLGAAAAASHEPGQLIHHKPGHASKGKGWHKGWRRGKGRTLGKHKGW